MNVFRFERQFYQPLQNFAAILQNKRGRPIAIQRLSSRVTRNVNGIAELLFPALRRLHGNGRKRYVPRKDSKPRLPIEIAFANSLRKTQINFTLGELIEPILINNYL